MKCRNSRLREAEKSGREILSVCGCRKSPSHNPVKLFDGVFFRPKFPMTSQHTFPAKPFFVYLLTNSPLIPVTRSSAAPQSTTALYFYSVSKVMFSSVRKVRFYSVSKVRFLARRKVCGDTSSKKQRGGPQAVANRDTKFAKSLIYKEILCVNKVMFLS